MYHPNKDGNQYTVRKPILKKITDTPRIRSLPHIIRWKMDFYHGLRINEFHDMNLQFILKDIFIKSQRKRNYALWEEGPKEIAGLKYGISYSQETPSNGLREVYFYNLYTRYPEFRPCADDIVLDAGAQYGDYALLCAKGYGSEKVFAFEPLKKNHQVLQENIGINNANNIETHQVALGRKTEEIEIYHENDMANSYGYGTPERVEVRSVDSYNINGVSLMKIDVEGFEMDLLEGAKRTIELNLPKIIIETHSKKLNSDVLEFLGELGYKKRHSIRNRPPQNRPEMDQLRNVFLSVD